MILEWKEAAIKELAKLEKNIASRIYKKISNLAQNFNQINIKRLQNSDLFRLRIGDFRVLFEIKNDLITILKISHRKNIYKR